MRPGVPRAAMARLISRLDGPPMPGLMPASMDALRPPPPPPPPTGGSRVKPLVGAWPNRT